MKYTLLLFLFLAGCGSRSPYDVTADQVKKHPMMRGPGGPIDSKHLPPGAIKSEKTFKKGDVMPDGTIADGDRKVISVEMH